jgi:hypothetical protein
VRAAACWAVGHVAGELPEDLYVLPKLADVAQHDVHRSTCILALEAIHRRLHRTRWNKRSTIDILLGCMAACSRTTVIPLPASPTLSLALI